MTFLRNIWNCATETAFMLVSLVAIARILRNPRKFEKETTKMASELTRDIRAAMRED